MIKLSVNETKWSCLLARTRAVILYISIWIFDFGPVKLPGLSRNGPQSTYQVSRIRVFLNPQLFLSVFEFARPSNKYPDSLQYPGLLWEYWQKSMRQGCHIHGKELGSILLRHRIKKNIRIWSLHDSRFLAYSKISTLESRFKKLRISLQKKLQNYNLWAIKLENLRSFQMI